MNLVGILASNAPRAVHALTHRRFVRNIAYVTRPVSGACTEGGKVIARPFPPMSMHPADSSNYASVTQCSREKLVGFIEVNVYVTIFSIAFFRSKPVSGLLLPWSV